MEKKDTFFKDLISFGRENPLLILLMIFFLLFSLYFRWIFLNIRTLEYDELYTVANFVPLTFSKIFTEVATPNNHMLHTFFVKLFHQPSAGYSLLYIRLCAAISGLLTILLFLPFRKNFHNLYAAFFAMFLFTLNGAHIHYSQTARGYTLLTFFLLLTIFSLWGYDKNLEEKDEKRRRKNTILYALLYFFSACMTSVSISIGVLFAFAASFSFLIFYIPWKKLRQGFSLAIKKYFPLCLTFTASSIFILSYFLPNLAQFTKGKNDFGMSINSIERFVNFFYDTFFENDLFYPLCLALCGLCFPGKQRKKIFFLLFAGFLVLFITLLTTFGPPRVYLPLLAFLLPAAGMGAGEIFSFLLEKGKCKAAEKKTDIKLLSILLFFLLLLPAYFSGEYIQKQLTPYDMGRLYNQLDTPQYSYIMPVFSPTDSVVLRALHEREAARNLLKKLSQSSAFLFTGGLHSLSYMERNKEITSSMPLPDITTPVDMLFLGRKFLPCVKMRKVEKPYRKNEVIFLSVFLIEEKYIPEVKMFGKLQCFHLLNYLQTIDDPAHLAGLFAAKAREVPLSPEEMLALEEKTQGRIRFRLLQK